MVNNKFISGGCFGRPLLFLLAFMWMGCMLYGRDFEVYRYKIYRKKFHLHLNTPVSFSPRARTAFKHPDFKQEFFPSVNFKLGLTGIYNLNTRYSLSAGLNLTWLSFYSMKRDFFIPARYSELYISADPMNYRGDLSFGRGLRFEPYPYFWSLPLNFIHRIPVTNRLDFRYSLGIDLKVYSSFGYSQTWSFYDVNNPDLPVSYYFRYAYSPDRKRSLCPDALFSAGLNRYLKNNKIINANFFVHVPMYKAVRGEFGFLPDTPYEAIGTFKKSELAFGFELNYIFTCLWKDKRQESERK